MKIYNKKRKRFGLLIAMACFFSSASMASSLTWTGSTIADNGWINANSFTAQLDILENNLDQFKRTRGGIDYSLYDSGLGLLMNFDNIAVLGENDANIRDGSQYGNIGSGMGGAIRSGNGKFGGAYQLDGVNDYISIPDSPSVDPTTAWTLSAWIKRSTIGTQHSIIEKYDRATGKGNYNMRIDANNKLVGAVVNGTAGSNCGTTTRSIGAGARYFVAATFDSNTNVLTCYVNAIVEATNTNATTNPPDSSLPLRIGARGNDAGSLFSGFIDEVRIYNRALSSGEIVALYTTNLAKYDTGKRLFSFSPIWTVNGSYLYTGYMSDLSGNTITTGRNISRTYAKVLYTYTGNTTIATLTGYNGLSIINNGGSNTYSFSGTTPPFYFIVQDSYGNTGAITAVQRNNDYFIDNNFWIGAPSSLDIINALYGDGTGLVDKTAYSKYWNSIICVTGNINVIYFTGGGTNVLPVTLAANTVYILSTGTYIQTQQISTANCSAIIGQGDVTIQANSVGNYVINLSLKNFILDNIKINRNSTGGIHGLGLGGSNHAINNTKIYGALGGGYGIFSTLATYIIINNSQIYNNGIGIQYGQSHYFILTNSQIYNNVTNGLNINLNSSGIINNCQIYNNNGYGIYMARDDHRITINNTQIYNNTNGIYYNNEYNSISNYNFYNNVQIYNNAGYGIYSKSGANDSFNNTWIYNNGTTGFVVSASSTNNKYYGTMRIFGNGSTDIGGTAANLTAGSSSDYPGLGRANGVLDQTNILSRDYLTNPKNDSGIYLLNWSGTLASIRGYRAYSGTANMQYSYGSGIPTQQQAVAYYTGSDITARETPVTTNYIGGSTEKIVGSVIGTRGAYTPSTITITGIVSSPASKYTIFGDLTTFIYGVDNNVATGFTFSDQLTTNKVIIEMYDPTNYFATHYQVTTPTITYTYPSTGVTVATVTGYNGYTIINNGGSNVYTLTGTDATGANLRRAFQLQDINGNINNVGTRLRNNDSYINSNFWNYSPNLGEIFSALYGDGSGGVDRSAYTQNRLTNTCLLNSGIRVNVNPGTDQLPTTLVTNTIYVLESGTYLTTAAREMGNCSAILGKGSVTIQGAYTTNTRLLTSTTKKNRVIDNVGLNRNYAGGASADVIYMSSSPSVTINNIQAYNGVRGIYFYTSSYGTVNNSIAYNNSSHAILYEVSPYQTITNSQAYNNSGAGIYFYNGSNYGMVKNCQSYGNNSVGIYFNISTYGTVTNCQSYNNSTYGIYFAPATSNYGVVNNSQAYNNTNYGICFYKAQYGVVNNSQAYNNTSHGIYFQSTATYGIVNNSQAYNNSGNGIYFDAVATNGKYYGDNKIFSNLSGGVGGTTANFITGSDGLVGRSNGSIDITPNMSRDYITNPINTASMYFLNRSGNFIGFRTRYTTYLFTAGMLYSYGSGILTQIQPVLYSGTTLVTSGTFASTNYIGGMAEKATGDLVGIGTYNGASSIVTGVANSPTTTYSMFGDITTFILGIPINTSTGITFSGGIATGRVITQIYYPGSYFATHFQKIATIDRVSPSTPTLVSPSSGTMFTTGAVSLTWGVATDTGVGMGGYLYQVSTNTGFTSFVISGDKTTTGVSLINFTDGTYYRRVSAYDAGGITGSRSSTRNFSINTAVPPTVSTGDISVGLTGANGGANYYKGTINIKATVSGTNITACDYTIDGSTRATASTGIDYCEATSLTPAADIHVQFRATNSAGTTTGGITDYLYDATGPSTPTLVSPSNGSGMTTSGVDLVRSASTDTGIGLSGYIYEISDNMGNLLLSTFKTTTGTSISAVDGTYTWRVYALDNFTTAGSRSTTFSFTINTNPNIIIVPTVGTGYISVGTTGDDGTDNYYKGTIHIKAFVSGTNITSCEYSTGISRATASTGIDYCEATSLTPAADIHVQFRATNSAGTTTGGATTYIYDTVAPSTPTAISPATGTYVSSAQVQLLRGASTDTGAGIGGYYYEVIDHVGSLAANGTSSTTGATIFGLTDGLYTWHVYAYDRVTNTGARSNVQDFGYLFSFDISFPSIYNQSLAQKFSSVHFAAPGNNFVGGIFRLTTKSLTGNEIIMIAGDPTERNCNKQVRGMYFNSQRGKRVWPLDQYTLALLQQTSNTYDNLQMSGGLFTSCTGYDYSIYGQISYNQSGTTSSIVAGTTLDYLRNDYGSGGNINFTDGLQYFNNKTPIGFIRDSFGGIGFVGGMMTGAQDLITYINNGGTINDAFTQTGTDITSTTGSRRFTSTVTGDNASNVIRNLLVQGSVGLSQSMNEQDRTSLLGNPQKKTIIVGTENINNATLINQAKKNMETLCKGKTRLADDYLSPSNDDVLCFNNPKLYIDLSDEALYHDKTIIMRNGNVMLSGSMEDSSSGLDLFIDQGNLYLRNNPANKQSFDNQGYIATSTAINSGTLLRGNIIINGLILGGLPGPTNITGYNHKLYIQGKISSLNTPFAPTQARIDFVSDVIGAGFDNRIGLQNVFVRTCKLNGKGTDGTRCLDASEMSAIPLVIVDGKYSSRLLDK